MRVGVWVVVVLMWGVAVARGEVPRALEQHQQAALSFLEQTPSARWEGKSLRVTSEAPVKGAVRFELPANQSSKDGRTAYRAASVLVHEVSLRVLEFNAGQPMPPFADETQPREALLAPATAVARRHAPEVFAADGEVTVTGGERITDLGDRRFRFQRRERGYAVPLAVEVGLRVFDGKLAWYRLDRRPYAPPAPAKIELAVAQQAALADRSVGHLRLVKWLDCDLALFEHEGRLQARYRLTGEFKPKDSRRPDWLEALVDCWVDPQTGEVVRATPRQLSRETYAWYRKHGGEHLLEGAYMRPELSFVDRQPVFSPDGGKVLFLSTRTRPGYPGWLRRPFGLHVVSTDGTGLRCLLPEPVSWAQWSPDGQRIACVQNGGVLLLNLTTGRSVRFEPAPEWPYTQVAPLADGRLAARASRFGSEVRLQFLDPAHPEAAPTTLPAAGRPLLGGLWAQVDGSLLYTVGEDPRLTGSRDPKRREGPWTVLRLQPATADAKPQVAVDYVKAGYHLGPGPKGRWLVGDGAYHWYLLDSQSGATQQFEPRIGIELDGRPYMTFTSPRNGAAFSPDGQKLVFGHDSWSGKLGDPAAALLWIAPADGQEAKRLTALEPAKP